MNTSINKKILFAWISAIVYSIIIFLTVPIALNIQAFISKHLGKSFFIVFIFVLLAMSLIATLWYLILKLKIHSPSNYIWLSLIICSYIFFILKLKHSPVETIHFLEYALLGFLFFNALKYHINDKTIYFTAIFCCLLVGTFDEILQWILPQRFWDFQDIGINVVSGGLCLIGIWKVIKPRVISEKINSKSLRILTSISIACILVLGLCASNTPKRVVYYTNLIPSISFLQKEEPMSEFGDRYKDPEIGTFYSRLTLNSMMKIDKENNQTYAQILNRPDNEDYEQFLKKYNPIINPFLYELRVHAYRRDKYFKEVRAFSDIKEKKESYFIAFKENLILEKYFGNTIKKSIFAWNEDKIKEAEAQIDKNKPYDSPVSSNLFNSFSEKTMWVVIFVIISILIATNIFLSLKEKQKRPIST